MEWNVLRRDVYQIERRRQHLTRPRCEKHLELQRYQVTEAKLRETRVKLSDTNCLIDRVTVGQVTFNDKKVRLLAQGISRNDTINTLTIKKSKIKVNHMEKLMQAVSTNESIEYICFEECNLLQKHGVALSQALTMNVSLKHLTLIEAGIGDLAMIEIAKGIREAICLEYVDLRHNHFERTGFMALVDALKVTMACKVLQLEGIVIQMEDAELLSSFLEAPGCILEEFDLHQAELEYDVLERINRALLSCGELTALSFSKNDLRQSIIMPEDSDSMADSMVSFNGGESQSRGRLSHQNSVRKIQFTDQQASSMTHLIADLVRVRKVDRLCLAHTYIGNRGVKILREDITVSNIKYLNISWCGLTEDSVDDLCSLYQFCHNLEKILMQHNELGGYHHLAKICNALEHHSKLKYLDISANEVTSRGLYYLLELQASNRLRLGNLQCRKNLIDGKKVIGLFRKLRQNKDLRVLNLSDNNLNNANAEEILTHYVQPNVYVEQLVLAGNKSISSSLSESIETETVNNIKIQEFILTKLPKAEAGGLSQPQSSVSTCILRSEYDCKQLTVEDEDLIDSHFITKFLTITNGVLQCLSLHNVHTDRKLSSVMRHMESRPPIIELRIENCPISETSLESFLKSLRENTHLKRLSLIDLKDFPKFMKVLYKAMKYNSTLEYLSIANNSIVQYKYIDKMIAKNKKIHTLDIRGNSMNEEILESLWEVLHDNVEIVDLLFDSQDKVLEDFALNAIRDELKINNVIQNMIIPHSERPGIIYAKGELNLIGLHFDHDESALIKFLSHQTEYIKKVDLSGSDIHERALLELSIELEQRLIVIEELNLSRIEVITDTLIEQLSKLWFQPTHNNSSSSVKTIILDETKLTQVGLEAIIDNAHKNTLLGHISVRNCQIEYDLEDPFSWKPVKTAIRRNCSITEIDLHGNKVPDDLLQDFIKEQEINKGIVEDIFPVLKQKELKLIKSKMKKMKQELRAKRREEKVNKQYDLAKQKNQDAKTSLRQTKNRNQLGSAIFGGSLLIRRKGTKTMKENQNPLQKRKVKFFDKEDNDGASEGKNNLNHSQGSNFQLKKTKSKRRDMPKVSKLDGSDSIMSEESEFDSQDSSILKSQSNQTGSRREFQSEISQTSGNEENGDMMKQKLSLHGKNLKQLDFLTKFVREFPKIQHIDLGNNEIAPDEMERFMETLEENQHIQGIDIKGNKKIGGAIKNRMQKELEKNKHINGILQDDLVDKNPIMGNHTINMKNREYKDISFLTKLMQSEDFASIQALDMSENNLDDAGAKQIADLLTNFLTITKLNISNNKLTQEGLQIICSAISKDSNVEDIDISENRIEEASLKMLMGTLVCTKSLMNIKYKLTSPNSLKRLEHFNERRMAYETETNPALKRAIADEMLLPEDKHQVEIKCWHRIIFPIWIWKTFIHAKHEAFRFKFDADKLMDVEAKSMKAVGIAMYVLTFTYFTMMFLLPSLFIEGECGAGIDNWVYYLYGTQALITSIYEVASVKIIERRISMEDILSFNRWHVVELIMGQIARLDTFLDACFLVMLIQCDMWNLVIPVSCFIILMLSYPLYMIFSLCSVNKELYHTQPFMERNCQLSFIRENMLLATVLDSFCIDNNVTVFGSKKPVAFGKLMGAYTFFCQDFPQLSIHLYFLFFMHDPASLILHEHPLVLVSLCVSCFAIMISLFNFVMFKLNDFDPILIEQELFRRRLRAETHLDDFGSGKGTYKESQRGRFMMSKSHLKRSQQSSLDVTNKENSKRRLSHNDGFLDLMKEFNEPPAGSTDKIIKEVIQEQPQNESPPQNRYSDAQLLKNVADQTKDGGGSDGAENPIRGDAVVVPVDLETGATHRGDSRLISARPQEKDQNDDQPIEIDPIETDQDLAAAYTERQLLTQ